MYGDKLKKIRKNFAATQEQMASMLGITLRNYAAYEREENNPPYSMLVLLCEKYNVNLNWFLAGQGEMFNTPKFKDVKDDFRLQVEQILKEKGLIK